MLIKLYSIALAIFSILLAQAAGLIGALFTMDAIPNWYAALEKPVFSPPNWIFGPVWTLLYTLMGIAAFLVWEQRRNPLAKIALPVYLLHLVLNALWSILFFGLKRPDLAFAEILLLLASILLTTGLFWKIKRPAGLLMLPYLAWVSFATALNYSIWILN